MGAVSILLSCLSSSLPPLEPRTDNEHHQTPPPPTTINGPTPFPSTFHFFLSFLFSFLSPTPARGNANGTSEITKQKEKRGCYCARCFCTLRPFFFRRGEPLSGFPFWCFVAGPVVKLRLGRESWAIGHFGRLLHRPLNKELDVPPSCLAKETLC